MRTLFRSALLLLSLAALGGRAHAKDVTIQGNSVGGPTNCWPFGGTTLSPWGPYMGFIYKNVPSFHLRPGDTIAFDLGDVGSAPIVVDIALASTVSNGSQQQDANGFTTVVSAASPTGQGDTIKGNYDLVFTSTGTFDFAGGGLIVRFHPEGSYASDAACDQVLDWSSASDSSGLFVARFGADADGVYPWTNAQTSYIGIVRFHTSISADANGPYAGAPNVAVAVDGTGSSSTAGAITTYEWDCTSDGTYDTSSSSPTGSTCTYPSTGTYTATLRITDSASQTDTATATVSITVPLAIAPATDTVSPLGTITFTGSGGSTTGYKYALTTNKSGGSIDATSGVYVAGTKGSVTDVVTLTDSASNSVTATITVGPGITISPATPSSPPRGSLSFTATGGSGTGYEWAITTNGSGGTVDKDSGAYVAGTTGGVSDVVTVTDSLGNTAIVSVSVGDGITVTPAAPTVAPRGTVTLVASGGNGTYDYVLTTNNSGGSLTDNVYTAGVTGDVSDLVTVSDSLGNSATVLITVGPTVTLVGSALTVFPMGSATFTASGGSGDYVYSFAMNASGGSIDAMTGAYVAGPKGQVTDVVRATDSNGNAATASITTLAAVSITPAMPSSAPRGSIAFSAVGGSGTGYAWAISTNGSGGTIDSGSGAYVAGSTGSSADTVTVTDSLGNTASVNVSVGGGLVVNPASPKVAPLATVALIAMGGSGTGYTWSITTNGSGGSIDASSGAYVAGKVGGVNDVVTVTDSLGNTATVTIAVGSVLTLSPASSTVNTFGKVMFTVSGGTGVYTWSFAQNQSGANVLSSTGVYMAGIKPGTDIVSVTDSAGNNAQATVVVTATGASMVAGGGGCSCDFGSHSPNSTGLLSFLIVGLVLAYRARRTRNS